jgi:hypothetical protein
LCGFLLLWRGLPASGDSLIKSSAAATGTAKPLSGSGVGSTEAKFERYFLMKCISHRQEEDWEILIMEEE